MIIATILGNIGNDAEVKDIAGRKYLSFRIASTRKKSVNGQRTEQTTWCSILTTYNENLAPYLKKGQSVVVSGEADINTYTRKDGSVAVDVSLFANSLQLAGGAKSDAGAQNASVVGNNTPKPVQSVQTQNSGQITFADESNLPF